LKYAKEVARCFNQYFAKYGNSQIHLWLIVTHPDFRRRGLGTMLTTWGLDKALSKGWPVTVFASPMGELLYRQLGLACIAREHIQVEGEDEKLDFAVMQYPRDTDLMLVA
jgi:GNAT superfamily N-acetyltransferase